MKNGEIKKMNMEERALNKEMLENVSGGIGLGTGLTIIGGIIQVNKTLRCNRDNDWGWKINAKCSCGLHPFYD